MEVPTPRISDRKTLEEAGYAAVGPSLKLPGSSTTYATLQKKLGEAPPPPPPPKRKLGVASSSQQFVAAPSPPVEAQLELCSALQGLGKLLDGGGDDTSTKKKKNPDDAKLEGRLVAATSSGRSRPTRASATSKTRGSEQINDEEDLAAEPRPREREPWRSPRTSPGFVARVLFPLPREPERKQQTVMGGLVENNRVDIQRPCGVDSVLSPQRQRAAGLRRA